MTALREATKIEELAPSILFPSKAPAGFDIDALIREYGIRAPFDRASGEEAAGTKVRTLASDLFTAAINDGFLPSEAADVVLQSKDYVAARADYIRWCVKSGSANRPKSAHQTFPHQLWAISQKLGRTLESAVRYENNVRLAVDRIAELPNPDLIPASLSSEEREANPLWFLIDPVVPDQVIRGMLGSQRAYAMSATLDGLLHRKRSGKYEWDIRLISAAATLWMSETHRYLALLASIPETLVAASLVPIADRFDLSKAIAEQRMLLTELRSDAA